MTQIFEFEYNSVKDTKFYSAFLANCPEFPGNRIKIANKKACDYSIFGSITVSLRRLKYT
jgi:hypothetical protein